MELPMPIREPIWDIIGPIRPLMPDNFASAFSKTAGNERNRSVCPVGAVSKMIVSYVIELTCLGRWSAEAFVNVERANSLHKLSES